MKWREGLLCLCVCFCAQNLWAGKGKATAEESGGFKGITISEKQIMMARGIANFLFSYKEDEGFSGENLGGENQGSGVQTMPTQSSEEKMLRVGIVRDNLPFTDMRDGEPVGFEVDLLRLLIDGEEVRLEFSPMDGNEIRKNMEENRIDVVLGGVVKLSDSDAVSGYSDGYLSSDVVAVTLKNSKNNGKKISFEGKSIGVIANSFFEQYIRSANIQGVRIITFGSNGEMFENLLKSDRNASNHIDILLTHSHGARDWTAKYTELEFFPLKVENEVAIQIRKGSSWLGEINRGIKSLTGSQKFSDLMRRWNIEKI
ncbi:MAG: transporter substrate-binding domain-containing protein [Puniceicoccales bacterium]|jgi:polar amino acid transport system substrate-binding protein|nr:transporter substrate-binding domain-containing protein [Puniceicoccales bacterium]